MESRYKLRLSRFLRVSFGSFRSLNLSNFLEKAVCLPRRNRNFHVFRPIGRKVRLFPSFCRPGSSEMSPTVVSYQADKFEFPIRDSWEMRSPFLAGNMDGRTCPPASPFSPETPEFLELNDQTRKKQRQKKMRNKKQNLLSVSEEDDEREETKEKFSISKSFSSDAPDSQRKTKRVRRKMSVNRSTDHMGLLTLQGKVRDSLAVVKESSDPYNDFRTSMIEMIIENKVFSAKDLEQLLQCFLSLNSHQHHGIIVQVFSEIWEALFQITVPDNKTTNKSSLFLRLL